MTYVATQFVLMCMGVFSRRGKQYYTGIYWFILIFLFLFAGFRYDVGCDWNNYLRAFNYNAPQDLGEVLGTRNPGHWAVVAALRNMQMSYTYLNVVSAGIFFYGLHVLAKRQPDPVAFLILSFPILVMNMPMSAIKQAAAIGIVCIALTAFVDRRLVRFLVLIGIATLFHTSAIVFVLFAPFIVFPIRRFSIVFAVLLTIPGLMAILNSGSAELAVSRYFNTGIDAAGAGFRLALLSLSGAAFLLFLRKRWQLMFPDDYELVLIGSVIMVVIFSLLFVSTVIGDRFGYYLIPIQLIIFSRLPLIYRKRSELAVRLAPYAILTTVFLVWTQLSSHFRWCYEPYQFSF